MVEHAQPVIKQVTDQHIACCIPVNPAWHVKLLPGAAVRFPCTAACAVMRELTTSFEYLFKELV
jgi:hypothetical protein